MSFLYLNIIFVSVMLYYFILFRYTLKMLNYQKIISELFTIKYTQLSNYNFLKKPYFF